MTELRFNDPFRLNDWKFRDFLVVVLAMQLSVLGASALAQFGLGIPIFRQIVGFLYLSFIPGFILLRVLRVHSLSRVSTLLYSVGLSIAFLMVLGLFLNVLLPLVAVSKPISSIPLIFATSAAVLILLILSYVRDGTFSSPSFFDTKEAASPVVLALCLIPALTVSGVYFVNFLNENFVLFVLLVVISILPILAMLRRFPERLYPLAIFVIALSLLYHNSLISMYLTGWDIQSEYYYSSLVLANSYWVSSTPSNINAMLSIVLLAPILSIVCDLNLVWVFKIFYPVFFSLVPLGLYGVWRKYVDDKTSFLSCFFFMSILTFYNEMPSLARQQIAELFQVLLILLTIDRSISVAKKIVFGLLFAFCLVTSHYGLSYIFMFSLVFVWAILMLRKWQLSRKGIVSSHAFVFLYCIFTIAWYLYVSGSSTLNHILKITSNIVANISEFANPTTAEGLEIIASEATSPLYMITKILYLIVSFLISAGVVALLLRRTKVRFEREYVLFSAVNFALLLSSLAVPYLASSLGTTRLYQVTLLFLAPFCVVGGRVVWDVLSRVFGGFGNKKIGFLKVLSVFLAVFFLFSSGFVYEIAKDRPSSISLNDKFDYPRFNEQEVVAAEWLRNKADTSIPTYSDVYRNELMVGTVGNAYYLQYRYINLSILEPHALKAAYLFLGCRNVRNEEMVYVTTGGVVVLSLRNLTLYDALSESSRIYGNSGVDLYFVRE